MHEIIINKIERDLALSRLIYGFIAIDQGLSTVDGVASGNDKRSTTE